MFHSITLVSHALCPYVQRIAIALAEKDVEHDRITVDLASKPAWFLEISPLGRTPVLKVGEAALFESAAILEFLEETQPRPLHPDDPVARARHRAWIGFGSECLSDIAGFYSAADTGALETKSSAGTRSTGSTSVGGVSITCAEAVAPTRKARKPTARVCAKERFMMVIPEIAVCLAARARALPLRVRIALSRRGSAVRLRADDDRPLHVRMKGAEIGMLAGCLEGDPAGVAAIERAGVPRSIDRRRRVRSEIVVGPGHAVANENLDPGGIEGEAGDAHLDFMRRFMSP
jgi:hypothetical protein